MGAVTAAVIGGVVAMGSANKASKLAREGRDAMTNAANSAAARLDAVKLPSIEDQRIILQTPELMGEYSPEQLQAMELNVSSMEGVGADQSTISKQEDALSKMSEIAEGGMSEGDKAAMREINRDVNQNAKARQRSILNDMAQRGALDSGMQLAAQLKGEQMSMDQASSSSDRAIKDAQARALQAISQQGDMASRLRGQQVNEQTDIARAQDAIKQFNLSNRQRVSDTNVGERNKAQGINLAMRQAQEEARVNARNTEETHNKGLLQTQFQNEYLKAGGVGNAQMAAGSAAQQASADAAARQAGIGGAVANVVGAIGGNFQSQSDATAQHARDVELAKIKAGQY